MKQHVLITGATGMIGKILITALYQRGYTISVLSRRSDPVKNAKVYVWDIPKQQIDPDCLKDVDTIIHLSGANIAEKRWTSERKKQLINSRVRSTSLLHKLLKENPNEVKNFISAAAVGYYGDCGDEILTEESANGFGFLADCCKQWEDAVDHIRTLGLRIVKVRTGIVLKKDEGALPALEKPIRFFASAPLGSGQQWVPWIHLDDLVNCYIAAIENPQMIGAYNACAPYPVTNATFIRILARQIHRPVWPLKVPEKLLTIVLGEMSTAILMSSNTSVQKLLETGFKFSFTRLDEALKAIYQKSV